MVPSSSTHHDYQPRTLARLSQQWDETNRAAVAEGLRTADGHAAVVPTDEPNSEQIHNLFRQANRDFAAATSYAQVSFLTLISAGVFAWLYFLGSLAPEARASCGAAGLELYLLSSDLFFFTGHE